PAVSRGSPEQLEQKQPYRGDNYCGVIARSGGPFRACHHAINPTPFLEDCAFDACHYKGHRDTLCKAIAAYVTECQGRGIAVEPWRTPSFCAETQNASKIVFICPVSNITSPCNYFIRSLHSPGSDNDAPPPKTCLYLPPNLRCNDENTHPNVFSCKPKWIFMFSPLFLAGPSCPHHSHYELCGSSCPATCWGRTIPEDCASVLCTEGCFCDEGFVLSGDECVPAGECGCEHRDRYYKKGEDFYASCRERCRCKELVVSGDPHYVTFDGRAFDLLGSCTYILARVCKLDPRLTNFSVLLEHDVGGRDPPTHACVQNPLGHACKIPCVCKPLLILTCTSQVDGERYTLPLVTEDKKLRIGQEGNNIILQTAAGLRLLYNVATYLLVTIPDTYRGRVCGLGGNYNGDPGDDFQLPGGSLAQSTEEFVTSWKMPMEDGACTDGCNGKGCPVCDATDTAPYSTSDSCGLIRDPTGPFGPCHPWVSPVEYFNHCLYDVCAAGGDRDVLCHSLQAYVAACQAAGAEIRGWRTTTFCPLSCPPHSHYELCTRTCDFTCSSLSVPAPCSWTCFEGCQCDDGYLFDGEACVSLERCGCTHQGRYFKVSLTSKAWL
uniref:VWFD domain-containing protein n=1 Tax=Strix occidentalis caurina TaxID=311401 RepID=A0A8D0F7W1_STROC